MFKKWSLRILTLLSLIAFNRSAFANASSKSMDTYLKLSITHAMYTAVIADHFEDQFENYNPVGLADRIFFMTFLTEWKEQIETRKYNTTKDIFSVLIKDDSYLRKFYKLWYSIHTPKKNYKNLYAKNWFKLASVSAVYNMEFNEPDPVAYSEKLLKFTSYHLITQNKQFKLALIIKEAFGSSKNDSIKHLANSLESNIEFKKFADKTAIAFNMGTIFLGGARLFKMPNILKNILSNLFNKVPKLNIPRSLRSGNLSFQKVGQSGKEFFIKNNPFTTLSLTKGLAISAVAHTAIAASLYKSQIDKEENSNTDRKSLETSKEIKKLNNIIVLIEDFSSFYDLLLHTYPIMTGTDYKDFTPRFELKSKEWIVKEGTRILLNKNKDDSIFSEVFLQAEKQLGVDERNLEDHLASHIIYNRYTELADEVENIFANTPEDKIIEKIRELLIKGPLKSYMRDNPSITSTLLDWGGNCVSRTALFIALLKPYEDRLPEGKRLGIYVEPRHIEPVIFNDDTVEHLMAGKKLPANNVALYHPNYLVHMLLRNFMPKSQIPLKTKELIIFDSRLKKTIPEKLVAMASLILSKSLRGKRQKGTFDTATQGEIINGGDYGNSIFNIPRDIPERALSNYRPISEQKYGTGRGGSSTIYFKENLTPINPLISNNSTSKNEKEEFKFILINSTPRNKVIGPQQDPDMSLQSSPALPFSINGSTSSQMGLPGQINKSSSMTLESYSDDIYLELNILNLNKKLSATKKLVRLKQILIRELENSDLLTSDLSKYQYELMMNTLSSCTQSSCITKDYQKDFEDIIEVAEQIIIVDEYISSTSRMTNVDAPEIDPLKEITIEYFAKLETHVSVMIDQRIKLLQYFTDNPKEFLIFFDSLHSYQRELLLNYTWFSNGSYNFIATLPNGNYLPKAITDFNDAIGKYLFRLDKVIVIPGFEMNTTISNAPVMSKDSSKRLGWKQKNTWNKEHSSETDDEKQVLSNSNLDDLTPMNRLQLKETTLIEVSLIFMYGHQLWTPEVIDTYKHGNFEHYYMSEQEIKIFLNQGLSNYILENLEIIELIRNETN